MERTETKGIGNMKVVCYNLSFNDTYTDDITPGKIYEVVFKSDFFPLIYTLKNDVGIITVN